MKNLSILKKKPVIIAFCLAFITSFLILKISSSEEIIEETNEKKNFFVETKSYKDFNSEYTIKKTWKISSRQSIDISSKASGQVASILVKTWDQVIKGQPLMYVSDSIANYEWSLNWAAIFCRIC